MAQLHVEAEGATRAGPEVVWPLLADLAAYPEWGPWDETGYEQPGQGSVGGVGAVRWLRLGRTTTVERVLEVDEGRRMAYTVVRGIPVRNYRAEVTLTPVEAGTQIRWVADWDATLLGRIVRMRLRTLYPDVVARLVAAADAQIAAP